MPRSQHTKILTVITSGGGESEDFRRNFYLLFGVGLSNVRLCIISIFNVFFEFVLKFRELNK